MDLQVYMHLSYLGGGLEVMIREPSIGFAVRVLPMNGILCLTKFC